MSAVIIIYYENRTRKIMPKKTKKKRKKHTNKKTNKNAKKHLIWYIYSSQSCVHLT